MLHSQSALKQEAACHLTARSPPGGDWSGEGPLSEVVPFGLRQFFGKGDSFELLTGNTNRLIGALIVQGAPPECTAGSLTP